MKRIQVIGIVVIAIAIGIIIASLGDSSSYEDFSVAQENPEREYHIVGKLVEKEKMVYNPEMDANYFEFRLQDNKGTTQKVIYKGVKPQDFERSDQVVIIGKMGNECFEAQKILTKCPSKYVENEVKTTQS